MRTGLLRGREHLLFGALSALAERRVAIALSRGGAEKNYSHRDPNEDACGFAWSDHAWLVAVADGHWGSRGAELALDRLLERHAPRWTVSEPDRARRPLVARGVRGRARPEPHAARGG